MSEHRFKFLERDLVRRQKENRLRGLRTVTPLGGVLVGLVVLASLKFQVQFNIPGFSISLAIGILGFFGAFMYLVAVSRGPLTLVAPVTALYPMFAILLGLIFLGEAITLRQGFGIGLSVVAIYLIST